MAFFNRASSILRQAVSASKHINHEMSGASPSLFQMIRCMSSSKVFVGGLAWATDDMSLREAFSAYGEVYEARVIMDRDTGRSRGFGFVTFADAEAASAAIQALDQRELHGRTVRVNYANERPQGGGGFQRGYGGDGGYGGRGDGGYGRNNYAGDRGYGNNYGPPADGGFGGGNNYGPPADGGFGGDRQNFAGNNYGPPADGGFGGESQNFSGFGNETQNFGGGHDSFGSDNADAGNAFGDADGQAEGSYRDSDEPDDFAKRA